MKVEKVKESEWRKHPQIMQSLSSLQSIRKMIFDYANVQQKYINRKEHEKDIERSTKL